MCKRSEVSKAKTLAKLLKWRQLYSCNVTNHFSPLPVLRCVICEGEKVSEFVASRFCSTFMEAEGIAEILPWNFYLPNVHVSLFEDREMSKMRELCGHLS